MSRIFSVRKMFLISLISSLSISALVAIIIFLIGDFGPREGRILLTTLAIGVYSLTGLCSSVLYDKRKYVAFAWVGIFVAVVGFLVAAGAVWEVFDFEDEAWKAAFITMIISFSIAHISPLLLARSEHGFLNALLFITIVCIAIVAIMLIDVVVKSYDDVGTSHYRGLGVFAVLDVLGTIVVPLLRRMRS